MIKSEIETIIEKISQSRNIQKIVIENYQLYGKGINIISIDKSKHVTISYCQYEELLKKKNLKAIRDFYTKSYKEFDPLKEFLILLEIIRERKSELVGAKIKILSELVNTLEPRITAS